MFVSALVAARMTADRLGVIVLIITAVAGAGTIASLVLARRRYRTAQSALQGLRELPDGKLPALVAGVCCLLGATAVLYGLAG